MNATAPALTFDITRPPPSAEAIAQHIRVHEAEVADMGRREKLLRHCSAAGFMLACIIPLVLWRAGIIGMHTAASGVLMLFAAAVVVATEIEMAAMFLAASFSYFFLLFERLPINSFAPVAIVTPLLAVVLVKQVASIMAGSCGAAKAALQSLGLIEPSRCPKVLEMCQIHPQLAAYQSTVASMGRFLVNGEADAMQRWADGAQARQIDEQRQAACRALKAPLAMKV